MKPIILTDLSDDPIEKIQEEVISVLSDNKISLISTTNDSLIVRPTEIQAVLITKKNEENGKSEESAKAEDDSRNS
jgi:hypothetical protein